MNRAERIEAKKLIETGLTAKQAYERVKSKMITGYRNPRNTERTESRRTLRQFFRKMKSLLKQETKPNVGSETKEIL